MKKLLYIFAVITIVTALFSVNVLAAGEPVWTKYMSKSFEEKTEDGETYYSIGGLTQSYSTPGLEIGSLIQEKAYSESITLTISFDARVNYVDDNDPVDIQLNTIFRGEGFTDVLKEPDTRAEAFEENYDGSFFKLVNKTNLMAYDFKGSKIALNEEWQTFTFDFELFREDLGIGLFEKWYFCFQNYNPIDAIEALEFKNTVVTVTGEGDAPAKTEVPIATETPTVTETPNSNVNTEAPAGERPTITKDPSKTVAPDSALSSIIANSCSCNNTLPIISIIISAIALIASIAAIAFVIRKKQ